MTKRFNDFVSIRLDSELKREFEAFCDSCGMTVSGAVNMLVGKVIEEHRIPFDVIGGDRKIGADEGGDTQILRASIRIDKDKREEFKAECERIPGQSMSRIIKMFMVHCINMGKLPWSKEED